MKTIITFLFIILSVTASAQNIWEPLNFPDSLNPQTINAENENHLFVTAEDKDGEVFLFRSNDHGVTWKKMGLSTIYFNSFFDICYNKNGVLFVGTRINIFRSKDDGEHFDTVYINYPRDPMLNIKSFDDKGTFVLGHGFIIRTLDDGDSWDTIFQTGDDVFFEDMDFDSKGNIFVVGGNVNAENNGFYRSPDGGETWEHTGITDKYLQTVNINAFDEIIVSGFGIEGMYVSSDSGTTWSQISEKTATVTACSKNNKLVAGCNIDGETGCRLSYDWGNSWIDLTDSILNPWIHQISISPDNYIYIQSDYYAGKQQLFRTTRSLMEIKKRSAYSQPVLFPNPAGNFLYIRCPSGQNPLQYKIYDAGARLVKSDKMSNNRVNVSNLNPGIYLIELLSKDFRISKKFLKK